MAYQHYLKDKIIYYLLSFKEQGDIVEYDGIGFVDPNSNLDSSAHLSVTLGESLEFRNPVSSLESEINSYFMGTNL